MSDGPQVGIVLAAAIIVGWYFYPRPWLLHSWQIVAQAGQFLRATASAGSTMSFAISNLESLIELQGEHHVHSHSR